MLLNAADKKKHGGKFGPRTKACAYIGSNPNGPGYLLWDAEQNRTLHSSDVTFQEHELYFKRLPTRDPDPVITWDLFEQSSHTPHQHPPQPAVPPVVAAPEPPVTPHQQPYSGGVPADPEEVFLDPFHEFPVADSPPQAPAPPVVPRPSGPGSKPRKNYNTGPPRRSARLRGEEPQGGDGAPPLGVQGDALPVHLEDLFYDAEQEPPEHYSDWGNSLPERVYALAATIVKGESGDKQNGSCDN